MDGVARAWFVWRVGLTAYVVAVLHRTSFGVAGLLATERFAVSASALAGFTVLPQTSASPTWAGCWSGRVMP